MTEKQLNNKSKQPIITLQYHQQDTKNAETIKLRRYHQNKMQVRPKATTTTYIKELTIILLYYDINS